MDQSFKNKTISGMIWKAIESGGYQLVRLVISIVLARILDPANYTTLALLLIFVNLADVFVKRGFATALIQKKDADNVDFSSVLWASLAIAGVLYLVLLFTAPAIASFYEEPVLTKALRILSVILFSGAFNSVQSAIITRKMEFRKLSVTTLGATIFSGIVGIWMAYAGYGIWSLVVNQLLGSVATMLLLWAQDRWKPMLTVSLPRIKSLFGYGWKLLVSSLLDTGYTELSSLVIGKRFIGDSLAFYNRGRQYPEMIANNLTSIALAVLFPAYSKKQDDQPLVLEMVRKTNRTTALMVFPMMTGMAMVATLLMRVLLTEKWVPAAPFLQVLAVVYALYPIEAADLQAINAIGRSDLYLKTEIIKKIFGILALAAAVFLYTTPLAIAYAVALTAVFSMFVTIIVMKRLFSYRVIDQIWDMLPPILLSGVMAVGVWGVSLIPMSDLASLIVQVVCGVAVYLGLAVLLKLKSLDYLRASMKDFLNRKKTKQTD
ncbi:MAG: lipopolysaccharide biosynthesis protein [Clostridiaceae bacterium]